MSQSIIKTQQLRFSYAADEGSVPPVVLDGVDLEIAEGSFVAVLGHNGSGKSTLAKHMNAILLPTGGKVYVSGIDTADEDALLDALDNDRLAGAAFDVYPTESAEDQRLLSHAKISCTPHIGGSTKEAQKRIGAEIVEIISDFFA